MLADPIGHACLVHKRSVWLKVWRQRWMMLEDARLLFFEFLPLDAEALETTSGCAGGKQHSLRQRRPTLSIRVQSLRDVWPVGEMTYRRQHCLAFFVQEEPSDKGATVVISAGSAAMQGAWVEVLRRVVCGELAIPSLSPAMQHSEQVAALEHGGAADADGAPDSRDAVADACQHSRSAVPATKGASKGRGKAPAPALPCKASGKGKGRGKGGAIKPPLGRVMTLRSLDNNVKLEDTVFGAMLPSASVELQDMKECDASLAALREAFCAPSSSQASRFEAILRRKAKQEVLDIRTAQNAEIVLRRISISVDDLREALETLDFNVPLTAEELDRLRQTLPSAAQLEPLLKYTGDTSQLRAIEQQLLTLGQVARMPSRLHVLALQKSLLVRRQSLLEDINRVRRACSDLMESRLLRDVLEAVLRMFNFVNHGVERLDRSTARGFDITSAMRVAEFKAVGHATTALPVARFTGLHFIVSQVLQKRPHVTWKDFQKELQSLAKGSGLNMRCIARDAGELHAEAAFLATELSEHRDSYEPTPRTEDFHGGETNAEPLLSPVLELSTGRQSLVPSAVNPVVQQLPAIGRCLACFAPKGASLLCEELPSRVRRWRCVRIGLGGMLEVHSKSKTRTISLRGVLIRPILPTAAASCSVAPPSSVPPISGAHEVLPGAEPVLGVEVCSADASMRFLCSTEEEVKEWVSHLRDAADVATAGWLGVAKLKPGSTRKLAFRQRWCIYDPDSREFRYYRSTIAARRMASVPAGRITVSGWDGLRYASIDSSPSGGMAESNEEADDLALERRSFTVNTRKGGQYILLAQSGNARDALLRVIEKHGLTARGEQPGPDRTGAGLSATDVTSPKLSTCARSLAVSEISSPVAAHSGAHTRPGSSRQSSECDIDSESSFTNDSSGDSDSDDSRVSHSEPKKQKRVPLKSPVLRPMPFMPQLNLQALSHSSTRGSLLSQAETDATLEGSSPSLMHFGFASSDEGDSAEDDLPTSKLSVIKKIERLKDTAALAEVEINAAVRQTCAQAAQTMRYFGQAAPDEVVPEAEALAPFAKSLQDFLQSVDRFVQQVTVAWKDLDEKQQERSRQGLGELSFKTPRTWAPVTAR